MHGVAGFLLTQRDAVPHLLDAGLIESRQVVEGGVRVVDASQRNRTFKVIAGSGPSFLLKQGIGAGGRAMVAHEAAVYRMLHEDRRARRLRRYLPRFHRHEADDAVLVLELMPEALNVQDYVLRTGRFSTLHARCIGRALAALHDIPRPAAHAVDGAHGAAAPADPLLSPHAPWVLSLHRPVLRALREFSSANIQLIKLVQEYAEFGRHFDELRAQWRSEAIIHGDLKWGNCVVARRSAGGPRTRVGLVDWELASLGDPAWDVGSVLHDYLSFWLISIPITGEAPPDRFLELARYPLERMLPAMGAFWQAYTSARRLDASVARELLGRAVRLGGARLVQAAMEQVQSAAMLTGNVVCVLQLALNIMARPREASVQLLALDAA